MSWQDFEDYEAEIRDILPDLPRESYITMSIVEGYKKNLAPKEIADKFIANSPCDFSGFSQKATIEFGTEDEAKKFYTVMQKVSKDAQYRAIRHIMDEQGRQT